MSPFRAIFSILCLFLAYSSVQAWNFGIDNAERTVKDGEFPWAVHVLHTCEGILGGGSLISNHAVLTSWKAIEDRNVSQIEVQIGDEEIWNETSSEPPPPPMKVRVRSIVRHPDFNPITGAYNLALLFLRKSVETTPKIRPVYLATQASTRSLDLNRCIVKGFATTTLPMPVVPSATCQQELRRWLGASFRLDASLMCAGGGIGRNICDEEGYPLVCPLVRNPAQFQQMGIVNWHINCGQGAIPDVYTNVVQHRDWIAQQIKLNPYVDGPSEEVDEELPQCDFEGAPLVLPWGNFPEENTDFESPGDFPTGSSPEENILTATTDF